MNAEIKRKMFHNIALFYILLYALLPRVASLWIFGLAFFFTWGVDWLRLRRPEMNAWFLAKFGGIHRDFEVMQYSGVFWTLLGSWAFMVICTNKKIVLAVLGFLAVGDTAAALVGKKWGKHHWPHNPAKTIEGSIGFAVASTIWGVFFLRPHAALICALAVAYIESRPFGVFQNDNVRIPIVGGCVTLILCILLRGV